MAGSTTTTLSRLSVRQGSISFNLNGGTLNLTSTGSIATSLTIAEFGGTPTVTFSGGTLSTQTASLATGSLFTSSTSSAHVTISSGTWVNSGTVYVGGSATGAGGTATLGVAGGGNSFLKFGNVVIYSKGIVDLNDNDMLLNGGTATYAGVTAYIATARNGGSWDGTTGITSTAAKNQASHAATLGTLLGSEYKSVYGAGATFNGAGSLNNSDVLVKYTWYGDTDFSGVVDFDDYVRTDAGYNGSGATWFAGDFDYNGDVDFDDYVLIDLGFNTQTGALGPGGDGFGDRWDEVAQLWHFHLPGYKDYLVEAMLKRYDVVLTDDDFYPGGGGTGRGGPGSNVPEPAGATVGAAILSLMALRRNRNSRRRI